MPGISVATSSHAKRAPKVLDHMEIHPRLGGGHIITHHYANYQHDIESHEFAKDEGGEAMAHIAKHAGLPHEKIAEHDADRPEPNIEDREEL